MVSSIGRAAAMFACVAYLAVSGWVSLMAGSYTARWAIQRELAHHNGSLSSYLEAKANELHADRLENGDQESPQFTSYSPYNENDEYDWQGPTAQDYVKAENSLAGLGLLTAGVTICLVFGILLWAPTTIDTAFKRRRRLLRKLRAAF